MSKGSVLIIEDDSTISMAIEDRLNLEGFSAESISNGLEGFSVALNPRWQCIILDLMLPGKDGLEICRDIRAQGIMTPVLMLTAKDQTVEKVLGLKMGADDYLAKPFDMMELTARVEALIRRSRIQTEEAVPPGMIGDYELDHQGQTLIKDGEVQELTTYEYKLLCYLADRRGSVVTRDELLKAVWSYEQAPFTRTVDIHIALLRKKLDDVKSQSLIVTVRGRGYKLTK